MQPIYIVGSLSLLFTLAIIILRSNAGVAVLALMAGFVLNTFVGSQASALLSSVFRSINPEIVTSVVRCLCVVLPTLLIVLFLRKTVSGFIGIINIPLAFAAGLLVALFAVPQLPLGLQAGVIGSDYWGYVRQYQVVLISASIFLCIAQFWLMRPKKQKEEK